MVRKSAWLSSFVIIAGCSQMSQPIDTSAGSEPAPLAPAVAEPKPAEGAKDCDCHAKHGAPAVENVDVSALELTKAPAKGRADAPVTMLVFCDFECPYCKKAQKTLGELERRYGDDLRIVFKQLPLPLHEHARDYAKAALAAHAQGKFWEVHDLLLSEEKLDDNALDRIALGAGLDPAKLRAAMASPEMEARLERERADAERVGARGTPTFVINGKKIVGAQPLETFTKQIDAELGHE